MPELPEVETVCRGLARLLVGRTIVEALVRRPDLRKPFPPGFAEALQGQRVLAVRRRAKYWLWDLESGITVLGHLGMSGRFETTLGGEEMAPLGTHDHVVLTVDDGTRIIYRDPRRFGLMTMTPTAESDTHPLLADIGPEPLEAAFTGKVLTARLAGKTAPIKPVLLDQTVVAGIGNIYASEALYRAGIHPARATDTLGPRLIGRLAQCIRDVLAEAVAAGGSTLQDHRQVDGELGYFQHTFGVYDKTGGPCPSCDCDLAATGGIQRIVQAGRASFFCARRQR